MEYLDVGLCACDDSHVSNLLFHICQIVVGFKTKIQGVAKEHLTFNFFYFCNISATSNGSSENVGLPSPNYGSDYFFF